MQAVTYHGLMTVQPSEYGNIFGPLVCTSMAMRAARHDPRSINKPCVPGLQVSVGKVEAGERATLAIHSMAEAHEGAATSASDLGSSLETRAVWRPCIPDNPYDHPLIVPSSPHPSPSTSPLPQHSSSMPSQQAFSSDAAATGSPPSACLAHASDLREDEKLLQDRLRVQGSPEPAAAVHAGTASAGRQQVHVASPPCLPVGLSNLQQSRKSHSQGTSQLQQQLTTHSSAADPAVSVFSDCSSSRSTSASEGQDQQELLQSGRSSHRHGHTRQQPAGKLSAASHATAADGSSNSSPLPQEAYQIPQILHGACNKPCQPLVGDADSAASLVTSPLKAGREATGEMDWLPGGMGSSFENGADDLRQSPSPPPPEASPSCPLNPPRKVSSTRSAANATHPCCTQSICNQLCCPSTQGMAAINQSIHMQSIA